MNKVLFAGLVAGVVGWFIYDGQPVWSGHLLQIGNVAVSWGICAVVLVFFGVLTALLCTK